MFTHCPHCQQKLRIADELAGQMIRCARCGHELMATSANEDLEETVSEWIVEDVQNVLDMKAKHKAILPDA